MKLLRALTVALSMSLLGSPVVLATGNPILANDSEREILNLAQAIRVGHDLLLAKHRGQFANWPKTGDDAPVLDLASQAAMADSKNFLRTSLVGTWRVTIPGPTPADTFLAYQTFHSDGTFTETSSLLGTLTEGPAHGAWLSTFGGGVLTFELFSFDPEGHAVGRIRVRNRLIVTGANDFRAESTVDVLPFDDAPILAVASGEFMATRLQIASP